MAADDAPAGAERSSSGPPPAPGPAPAPPPTPVPVPLSAPTPATADESLFGEKRRLRMLFLAAVAFGVLALGYRLREVLNPFLLALLLAYILDPLLDWLERRRVPRVAAILGLYLLAGGAAAGIVAYSIAKTSTGIEAIYEKAIGGWFKDRNGNGELDVNEAFYPADREERIEGSDVAFLDINGDGRRTTDREFVEPVLEPVPDEGWRRKPGFLDAVREWVVRRFQDIDPVQVETAIAKLKENAAAVAKATVETAAKVTGDLFSGVVTVVSYFFLVPIYAFFLCLGFDRIVTRIRDHLPGRHRPRIIRITRKIDRAVAAFFRGQLMICLGKGVLTWLGLSLIGVDLAFFIGVLAAILAIVPFLGSVVAFVLAVAFGYGPTGWAARIIASLVLFIVIEVLDSIAKPVLLGRGVGMHALTIFLALFMAGELFGFFGVLLAVPLAAIVKILAQEFVYPEIMLLASEGTAGAAPSGPVPVPAPDAAAGAPAEGPQTDGGPVEGARVGATAGRP